MNMKKLNRNARVMVSIPVIAVAALLTSCGSSSTPLATGLPLTSSTSTTSCNGGSYYTGCNVVTEPPGSPGEVCSVNGITGTSQTSSNGTAICRVEFPVEELNISSSYTQEETLNFLSPTALAGGGVQTGVSMMPGDDVLMTANGHYSWSTGGDNTCDDISVLGAWSGHNPSVLSNADGVEGLYAAFLDTDGAYSAPVFVNSQYTSNNSQTYISTRAPSVDTSQQQLILGYNVDGSHTMNCGTIQFYYQIIRCADASGNTYPCQ
jgi:hypothetical protein